MPRPASRTAATVPQCPSRAAARWRHAALTPKDETTTLLLATGETVEVVGPLDQVAKELENATRSSPGTLAWFDDAKADDRLGLNPSHVVLVRRGPE